jgi:hypothetical protein
LISWIQRVPEGAQLIIILTDRRNFSSAVIGERIEQVNLHCLPAIAALPAVFGTAFSAEHCPAIRARVNVCAFVVFATVGTMIYCHGLNLRGRGRIRTGVLAAFGP